MPGCPGGTAVPWRSAGIWGWIGGCCISVWGLEVKGEIIFMSCVFVREFYFGRGF